MAKNSVDSKINLAAVTFIRREGVLVEVTDSVVVFKHKKPGGQRMIQQGYARSAVAAFGDDFIVVQQHARLPRAIFREISGAVTIGKDGWYAVDGINLNPLFAEVVADLGVEGGAAKKPKAEGGVKKKKKAA